jgi:hypothetical protein
VIVALIVAIVIIGSKVRLNSQRLDEIRESLKKK